MNKKRLDTIYADAVKRWKSAWDRFLMERWRLISNDELQAYKDFADLPEEKQAGPASIIRAWIREIPDDEPDDGEVWGNFLDNFHDAMPEDLDKVDLSLWPDRLPAPPPDQPRMWEIARRDKGKGADERLAAGWALYQLACGCVAREYSREVR